MWLEVGKKPKVRDIDQVAMQFHVQKHTQVAHATYLICFTEASISTVSREVTPQGIQSLPLPHLTVNGTVYSVELSQ